MSDLLSLGFSQPHKASGRGVPRGETRRRSGFPFWGARKIAEYLANLFDNKNVYRTLVTQLSRKS